MSYGLSTALSGADCYLGRLDELKKDGISHLELCLREDYGGQAALYEGALAAIQAAGLTVFSVHLPFGMSVSPACTKQAQRQECGKTETLYQPDKGLRGRDLCHPRLL